MGPTLVINNYVHAWRIRGMDHAMRQIGGIVVREPRRAFPGVELRERTKLRRGLLYRTLESLVDQGWLGVDSMHLGGRLMNVYFVTQLGTHQFAALLGHSNGDGDISSGDNSCRQVEERSVRVERVDPYHVALVSEAQEAQVIPNNEFAQMLADVRGGEWDELDCHKDGGSVSRIRT